MPTPIAIPYIADIATSSNVAKSSCDSGSRNACTASSVPSPKPLINADVSLLSPPTSAFDAWYRSSASTTPPPDRAFATIARVRAPANSSISEGAATWILGVLATAVAVSVAASTVNLRPANVVYFEPANPNAKSAALFPVVNPARPSIPENAEGANICTASIAISPNPANVEIASNWPCSFVKMLSKSPRRSSNEAPSFATSSPVFPSTTPPIAPWYNFGPTPASALAEPATAPPPNNAAASIKLAPISTPSSQAGRCASPVTSSTR